MNGIRQAIEENTAARGELAEAIRAVDFNGHVPGDEPSSDYDRGYRAGYNQALLNVVGKLAEQAAADLAAINDKLEGMARRPAA